jgi:putative ABC transport system permease protein
VSVTDQPLTAPTRDPGGAAPDRVAPTRDPGGAAPGRVAPDRVAPGRVAPDRVAPDRVAPDRVAPGRPVGRLAGAGVRGSRPAPGASAAPAVADAGAPVRPRTAGGVLLLPPWRRAPLLPFGQPAVLLAVLAAAAILACAAASAPLFLSSASSAALQRLLGQQCASAGTAAVKVRDQPALYGPAVAYDLGKLNREVPAAMTGAGLPAPTLSALAANLYNVGYGATVIGRPTSRVVYRSEALANVTKLPGAVGGTGVWLPKYLRDRLGARPGSTVTVGDTPVRLAGYYGNLYEGSLPAYWCSYGFLVLPNEASNDVPPPLVLATDPATYSRLTGDSAADYEWVSTVDTSGITVSRARDVERRQVTAYRSAGLPVPLDLGRTNGGTGQLPALADRAELVRDGLRGPVLPIALGGTLLALLLVGAAGSYWADRRVREVRLLSARGVGPGALAGKAVLELALPAAVGTVLGTLLARWLVARLGPSPNLDAGAYGQAAVVVAGGLLAGLALLGLVAGIRSRNATERPVGARRSRLAWVPWEVLLLAGAAGTYAALRGGHAVTVVANIAQVNLLVVVFPLLFILGGSVLAVRLLTLLLPVLSTRATRLPAAWYLAARRLSAARVAAVVLLAAAAAPVAIAVYAAGLTAGSQQTLDAKALTFTGAAVSVETTGQLKRDAATDRIGTIVRRYSYGTVGSTQVAFLAVDRDTLPRTAYWREEFAGRSLPDLLAALAGPAPDGRLPAIVVDPRHELGPTANVRLGTSTARVATAATARLFPGRRLPQPMIVVDRARLGPVDPHAGSYDELWTNGPAAPAEAEVLGQDRLIFDTIDQAQVFDAANFLGITWTFGYLTALAGLVGLVSVGALLLYVETRQRTRIAAYALGRRMGLSRATHLRSLLAELGLLLGLAYAVGVGLSRVALGLVHGLLDLDPARPPTPLLVLPVGVLAGAAVAVAVVAVLTALYAQRVADRTSPAETLRLGT